MLRPLPLFSLAAFEPFSAIPERIGIVCRLETMPRANRHYVPPAHGQFGTGQNKSHWPFEGRGSRSGTIGTTDRPLFSSRCFRTRRKQRRAEQERGPDFFRLANALSALYAKESEEKRLLDAVLLAVPR